MKVKKMIALLTAGAISASVLTGCGNAQSGDVANGEGTSKTEIADNSGDELPDVELWNCMTGLPVEKDSPLYNLYKEKIGVGIVQPYVEWRKYIPAAIKSEDFCRRDAGYFLPG